MGRAGLQDPLGPFPSQGLLGLSPALGAGKDLSPQPELPGACLGSGSAGSSVAGEKGCEAVEEEAPRWGGLTAAQPGPPSASSSCPGPGSAMCRPFKRSHWSAHLTHGVLS